jgi:hypothetical protein
MGVWAGPFLIAVVLLAGAGAAKVHDPSATVGALRGFGVRVPPMAVRAGGALEVLIAGVAGVTGHPVAVLAVAASYALFTAFVVVARARRLPIGSCGCFGKVDTPPSGLHVVVNLGAVVAATGVAARGGGDLGDVVGGQPLAAVPMFVLVLVGAYAAFTALTTVPQLRTLRAERSG